MSDAMADPVSTYNDALQKLQAAAREVERMISVLRRLHDTLEKHWRRTVVGNTYATPAPPLF
jgi:hypothetical protein